MPGGIAWAGRLLFHRWRVNPEAGWRVTMRLHHADSDQRLVLIRQTSLIGSLPGNHQVFRVNKVVLLPLSVHESPEMEMEVRLGCDFGKVNRSTRPQVCVDAAGRLSF